MASEYKKALENYVQVKDRIKQFREEHGTSWGIQTHMMQHEPGVSCTFRAVISDEKGFIVATGHAHDKTSDNTHINITSLIENCETSAIGRALAMMGYGIEKSIASREEVRHLEPKQYTGTKQQQGTLARCLRSAKVTDKELAKTIHEDAIAQEIKDDELTLSKFIKEYEA